MWPFEKKEKPQQRKRETIDKDKLVASAYALLQEYRSAYAAEWERLDRCEEMYRGDHWSRIPATDRNEPRPVTPALQSTIENVSADLMDRMPQAVVQPENPDDKEIADVVDALIRQNHDAANYRREYGKACHDLLTDGYCVQEVGYDVHANRGLGGAFIRYVDCRNILFDPQAEDIQDGRAVIKTAPRTIRWLEQMYPDYQGRFTVDEFAPQQDTVLTYDQTKSVLFIEYWWREYDREAGVYRVHMAQLAGHILLGDSRDAKPDGYFADGEYPFFVTPLFRRKATALGWGFVDQFGEQQKYSDKLDQIVLKNALMASHNKLLVTEASGFDVDDLRDWSKEVHRGESLNGVTWFATPPLPAYVIEYISRIRENMKDFSGANDFSRGNTTGGVTAAEAINALQEMSSKRSRQISALLYETFKECVRKEIEIEREYNVLPREVQLVRDGEQVTATFETAMLQRTTVNDVDVPIEFFVSIKVEQENRWQAQTQNETVLKMVELQMLTPEQAVELMVFDGKETVLAKAAEAQQPAGEQQEAAQTQEQQEQLLQQIEQMPTPETALA